jgi:hypothetical protein
MKDGIHNIDGNINVFGPVRSSYEMERERTQLGNGETQIR